jgi:alpha-L-fucosidase
MAGNYKRRVFVRQMSLGAAALTTGIPFVPDTRPMTGANDNEIPRPTPAQLVWQQCETGLIYHFDISVAVRRHDRGRNAFREVFDPRDYNPEKLNTDQWMEAALAAGAGYAIFTATHFNGFLQWQSAAYPYGLRQARWKNGKGDIVGDFVNSCYKAGIKPGIYLSTHRNVYWQLWDYYVDWGKGKGTPGQEEFNRAAEIMTEELSSRYGPLVQIWFDAGTKLPHEGGPDILPVFDKYQPGSVFYHSSKRSEHRWIGNEKGYAGYPCWATMPRGDGVLSHNSPYWKPVLESGDPDGEIWSPGMVDVPLRAEHGIHSWFWAPDQDYSIYPLESLVDIYYTSVGRNCNLVIGEVVNPEGLVPEADIIRLQEFGDEIKRRFSNPVGTASGRGNTIVLYLSLAREINHVIIQENIRYGERIREYTVDGLADGQWVRLCQGESVGHKRIERFETETCEAIRLLIGKSIAEPLIDNFSAFMVE